MMPRQRVVFACLLILMNAATSAAELRSGPMAGASARDEAVIWLMATGPANVVLEYWSADSAPRRITSRALARNGYTAHLRASNLLPGTRYQYRVLIDGKTLIDNPKFSFVTQALPGRRPPRDFAIATGSCAYLSDALERSAGKGYGGGYGIFDVIAAGKPDVMLWLGDSIYYRDTDFTGDVSARMNERWTAMREFAPLQNLLRTGHHYAIWDDHDYGPDNADRSFALKAQTLALFKRYWANRDYGLPETPGAFSHTSFEDVDLFLLDDRYYRDDDNADDRPGKTMLGSSQIEWLKHELRRSTATFKLVVNGSRMLSDRVAVERRGGEGWHNFADEREAFLDWLHVARIDGVMFVSGDIHYTHLTERERAGTYPLRELTCSPLTSRVHPRPNPIAPVPGTVVTERNYCRIEFSGPPQARAMRISAWSANGRKLWQREYAAEALHSP